MDNPHDVQPFKSPYELIREQRKEIENLKARLQAIETYLEELRSSKQVAATGDKTYYFVLTPRKPD